MKDGVERMGKTFSSFPPLKLNFTNLFLTIRDTSDAVTKEAELCRKTQKKHVGRKFNWGGNNKGENTPLEGEGNRALRKVLPIKMEKKTDERQPEEVAPFVAWKLITSLALAMAVTVISLGVYVLPFLVVLLLAHLSVLTGSL